MAELFAGYGGLGMGVTAALGDVDLAWYSEIDAAPSKIMAHHHPEAPNLGDITRIDWSTVERPDILTGGFPCFAVGTPVLTARGLVGIEDVREGDDVWTHAGRWRKVTATMSREAETVEFRPGFYSTPEHRLWMRRTDRLWRNDLRRYRRVLAAPEWVPAEDSRGYFTAMPTDIPAMPHGKPERLSWWQVGRWLADGFCSKAGVHVYVGHGKAGDLARFDGWTVTEQRTALRARLPRSSAEAAWLTDHFGALAHGKTVPAFALGLPAVDRRDLLDGYWSGDGCPFQARSVRSASVSPALTVGVAMLAAGLGFTVSTHYNRTADTTVVEGRTVSQRDWWSVTATPDDGRYAERTDGWLWQKQRRTPTPAGRRTVYDLTVADDHSFIAAGIVVHNCQDVSVAGSRAGMTDGTRSGLWSYMRTAIDEIRPGLVVIENVGGLFSAQANRIVESCPYGLGDGRAGEHTVLLRAAAAVLGDLAALGYDAQWVALRAADVGAPHGRLRVFISAHPAGKPWSTPDRHGGASRAPGCAPGLTLLPTPAVNDMGAVYTPDQWDEWTDRMRAEHGNGNGHGKSLSIEALRMLPTPGANLGSNGGPQHPDKRREGGHSVSIEDAVHGLAATEAFGPYAPAIARWEAVLGRSAPDPTEPGKTRPRLSAAFVEWMMGLPEGHVTGVDGLTRSQQLKALGNGVVPQQAEAAIRYLTTITI